LPPLWLRPSVPLLLATGYWLLATGYRAIAISCDLVFHPVGHVAQCLQIVAGELPRAGVDEAQRADVVAVRALNRLSCIEAQVQPVQRTYSRCLVAWESRRNHLKRPSTSF